MNALLSNVTGIPRRNPLLTVIVGAVVLVVVATISHVSSFRFQGQSAVPNCGDGFCESGEDTINCPADCTSGPSCGDMICDSAAGENSSTCPGDCGGGAVPGNYGQCAYGNDGVYCCSVSGAGCVNVCNDFSGVDTSTCHGWTYPDNPLYAQHGGQAEAWAGCNAQCGGGGNSSSGGPTCGDGMCDSAMEDYGSCPVDCGCGPGIPDCTGTITCGDPGSACGPGAIGSCCQNGTVVTPNIPCCGGGLQCTPSSTGPATCTYASSTGMEICCTTGFSCAGTLPGDCASGGGTVFSTMAQCQTGCQPYCCNSADGSCMAVTGGNSYLCSGSPILQSQCGLCPGVSSKSSVASISSIGSSSRRSLASSSASSARSSVGSASSGTCGGAPKPTCSPQMPVPQCCNDAANGTQFWSCADPWTGTTSCAILCRDRYPGMRRCGTSDVNLQGVGGPCEMDCCGDGAVTHLTNRCAQGLVCGPDGTCMFPVSGSSVTSSQRSQGSRSSQRSDGSSQSSRSSQSSAGRCAGIPKPVCFNGEDCCEMTTPSSTTSGAAPARMFWWSCREVLTGANTCPGASSTSAASSIQSPSSSSPRSSDGSSTSRSSSSASSQSNSASRSSRLSSSSARSSSSSSQSSLNECAACVTCGNGLANVCDQAECLGLGSCLFIGGIFYHSCMADPNSCPPGSASSGGSSSSFHPSAGECTDCASCGVGPGVCDAAECNVLGPCLFTNGWFINSCDPDPAQCNRSSSSSPSSISSFGSSSQSSIDCGYCSRNDVFLDPVACEVAPQCNWMGYEGGCQQIPSCLPFVCDGGSCRHTWYADPDGMPMAQCLAVCGASSQGSSVSSASSLSSAPGSSTSSSVSSISILTCVQDSDCGPRLGCPFGVCCPLRKCIDHICMNLSTCSSASSIGSSKSSSRASSPSSGSSATHASKSSSGQSAPMLCTADACEDGGNNICGRTKQGCLRTNVFPCFRCSGLIVADQRRSSVAVVALRSASSASFIIPDASACTGGECLGGGNAMCKSGGKSCEMRTDFPCVRCVAPPSIPGGVSPPSEEELCKGTECNLIGSAICGRANLRCSLMGTFPCFQCTVDTSPICGNGILEAEETCEDRNGISGDGCSRLCALEPGSATRCGDGTITGNEECDDGNSRDVDGCSRECLREQGLCGDGVLQRLLGEQCEPTLHDAALFYGCSSTCRFLSFYCGNGQRDLGEECDAGAQNSDTLPNRCRLNCSSYRCGDSVLDDNELCDDGNRISQDGCDAYCRTETAEHIDPVIAADVVRLRSQALRATPSVLQVLAQPLEQLAAPFASLSQQIPTPDILPYQAGEAATTHAPVGDTGPAALAIMAAGAASGLAWVRRKRKA